MATLDVLTEAQAFEALKGLKSSGDTPRVMGLVTAVSKRLDEACGPVVARTVTELHRDAGAGRLFLAGKVFADPAAVPPIAAPAITEAWLNETPVVLAATGYQIDNGSEVTKWSSRWGSRVTVTYTTGRFASTAAVTEPFITAAGMLLQHWWRPSNGGGSETYGLAPGFLATGIPSFGFPNTVRDVLAGEMLAPAVA